MKRLVIGLLFAACILGLIACGQKDVLHLGLNAEITAVDPARKTISVKDLDADGPFGECCLIECSEASILYCNYKTHDVKSIDFADLRTGDHIILGIYENELNHAADSPLKATQVQLGTQRIN